MVGWGFGLQWNSSVVCVCRGRAHGERSVCVCCKTKACMRLSVVCVCRGEEVASVVCVLHGRRREGEFERSVWLQGRPRRFGKAVVRVLQGAGAWRAFVCACVADESVYALCCVCVCCGGRREVGKRSVWCVAWGAGGGENSSVSACGCRGGTWRAGGRLRRAGAELRHRRRHLLACTKGGACGASLTAARPPPPAARLDSCKHPGEWPVPRLHLKDHMHDEHVWVDDTYVLGEHA
ncbi:Protein of unknown function [Gryllus bimaculatus]|nr:Protein of unknown function [Gryllus bimaculatus]